MRLRVHSIRFVLVAILVMMQNSQSKAALPYSGEIQIQPIYVNSYQSDLLRPGPYLSSVTAKFNQDLAVARSVFNQIGITLNVQPLRVDAIEISAPSFNLRNVIPGVPLLWSVSDAEQLVQEDPFKPYYKGAHVVPIYILPDYDTLGSGNLVGRTFPPEGNSYFDPLVSPGVIVDYHATPSTLAHEIGHFLLDGASFAPAVAADPERTHLSDPHSLMSGINRLDSTDPRRYGPGGDLGQIGFEPMVVPDGASNRPTNQVGAMHHRGANSLYLRHNGNNSGNVLPLISSTTDKVGEHTRAIGGYLTLPLRIEQPVAGELRVTSTVPNDPTNGQVLPYTVQQSFRRAAANMLEVTYQLDFADPYSFTFQGGTAGEFTLRGTFTPNSPVDPMYREFITGPATLKDARVCVDALCNAGQSISPSAFVDTSFANATRLGVVYDLKFLNSSIVNAESLKWTIQVPTQFGPLYFAGDFNTDTSVDTADFITWRKGLSGQYSAADYNFWRANFGKSPLATAGGFSQLGVALPEPSTLMLLSVLIVLPWCSKSCQLADSRALAGGVFRLDSTARVRPVSGVGHDAAARSRHSTTGKS